MASLLAGLPAPGKAEPGQGLWSRWQCACRRSTLPASTSSLLPALRSSLFDPAQTPLLNEAHVNDDALLAALRILCPLEADERIDWRRLPPLHIGSAYEALLGLHPVPASPDRPFTLEPRRLSARAGAGAFYTPHSLVNHLLDEALEPLVRDALAPCTTPEQRRDAILALRICDPACGCGNFLLPATERLADHLLTGAPALFVDRTQALCAVLEHSIHGVDIDPLAVELARAALWLAIAQPAASVESLTSRIVCGDALVGAESRLVARGIPDRAIQNHCTDCQGSLAGVRRANRAERRLMDPLPTPDACGLPREAFDVWSAAFFARPGGPANRFITTADLAAALTNDPAGTLETSLAEGVRSVAAHHRFLHWERTFPRAFAAPNPGFDLVIGNPPFLNQLETATATSRARAALLSVRTDGLIKRYADEASAFLAVCFRLLRPRDGSRLAFVQPQSVLSASDIIPLRRALLDEAVLDALWLSGGRMFADASVQTCAVVFIRSRQAEFAFRCTFGPDFDPVAAATIRRERLRAQDTWSELVAPAFGVPDVRLVSTRTLADIATATADFRDQYYGLEGFIVESRDLSPAQQSDWQSFPPIVTSGLIDLAACRWSRTPTRLLRRPWLAPRLDRQRMQSHGDQSNWVDARLIPKVLLATQTRVIEVYVDEHAHLLPSVPVITITPRDPSMLWQVAAALASPVATAEAARRYAGSGLHHHAIKLSARQSLTLPLPLDEPAWRRAGADFQRLQSLPPESIKRDDALRQFARTSCDAYALTAPAGLVAWWLERQGLDP